MTQNDALARRQPQAIAQQPTCGVVTIGGQQHIVTLAPTNAAQPVIHQPIVVQPTASQAPAQYVVQRDQGARRSFNVDLRITPVVILSGLIMATLFLVGASMFSIALTGYSNSQGRIDRLQRLIYVEPGINE